MLNFPSVIVYSQKDADACMSTGMSTCLVIYTKRPLKTPCSQRFNGAF